MVTVSSATPAWCVSVETPRASNSRAVALPPPTRVRVHPRATPRPPSQIAQWIGFIAHVATTAYCLRCEWQRKRASSVRHVTEYAKCGHAFYCFPQRARPPQPRSCRTPRAPPCGTTSRCVAGASLTPGPSLLPGAHRALVTLPSCRLSRALTDHGDDDGGARVPRHGAGSAQWHGHVRGALCRGARREWVRERPTGTVGSGISAAA